MCKRHFLFLSLPPILISNLYSPFAKNRNIFLKLHLYFREPND